MSHKGMLKVGGGVCFNDGNKAGLFTCQYDRQQVSKLAVVVVAKLGAQVWHKDKERLLTPYLLQVLSTSQVYICDLHPPALT